MELPVAGEGARYGGGINSEMLGISELSETQYEAMRTINGYTYETPPGTGFASKAAQQRFVRFAGALNPRFTPDTLDHARERLQVFEKKERKSVMEALGVLYAQRNADLFLKNKNVVHAEFERMLNPSYAPKFVDAMKALDLPVPMYWKHGSVEMLENISRLPLADCDNDRAMNMLFEEWYQLFWNFAMPFNPVAFYCVCTSQRFVYTQEFITELAHYLASRLQVVKHDGQPIVHVGCRLGKMAALINKTKILPVPIVCVHENPNANPYVIKIPPHCQAKFKPHPVEKLKLQTALEKYKPSLVILSDMNTQQDVTQDIRAHGCVKEYLTLGMTDCSLEGHGWHTFGVLKFRPEDEKTMTLPPYMRDGFRKYHLTHLSRWMIHRYDQRMVSGVAGVMSFSRANLTFSPSQRLGFFAKRIATRF